MITMQTTIVSAEDYRAWSQTDSRWSNIPLGSSGVTISTHGCLVSAITKLIIQSGFKSADSFNIKTFANWLNDNNGYNANGELTWKNTSNYVNGFSYDCQLLAWGTYNSSSYNDKLVSWVKSGYHLVLNVNNGGHWVAVDGAKTKSTGLVYIMDSGAKDKPAGADIQLANRYSSFNIVHAFKGEGVHTHNFYYAGAESAHPHYKFYKCSCGVKEVHKNELYNDPNCTICNPTYCVSEGEYHIVSALDNSLGLNIAYNSTESGANVQLWDNMDEGNLSSLVSVKYLDSGYYTMTFMNSGKNLDVQGGSPTSDTNVQQYSPNSTDSQKWIIAPTGDGYFYIVTKLQNNLFLDAYNASSTPGTNVWICTGNATKAQKWKFIASGVSTGQTIKNGEYTIASAINNNYGLNIAGGSKENGGNIQIWNNMHANDANARVNVEYLDYGLYKLTFTKSNKVLDIDGSHNTSDSNIHQWDYVSKDNQKWIIKSAGDGYYYIIGEGSGLAVDITGGSVDNGTNIQAHVLNYSNAQKWKFELVPKKITYDANGGTLFNDTVTSVQIDGVNSSREDGTIVIYTSSMYSKSPTNIYGDEYAFDKNGKKVGKRTYGTEEKLDVPMGGFVVSKQATNPFDLHIVGETAQYAFCDYDTNTVYFYNNEHDYLVGSKKATPGSDYGVLATPVRDGYTFDGWYTSADGGDEITANSIYNGVSTLYARWEKNIAPENAFNHSNGTIIDISEKFTRDEADTADFGIDGPFQNLQILGVQKKETDGENSIRFVAVVKDEILQDADDYGFIAIGSGSLDKARTAAQNMTIESVSKTFSCKGKSNLVSGDYGKFDSAKGYKYVTFAVNNVGNNAVGVKFYIQKGSNVYYADYINENNETLSYCAADWAALS